MTARVARPFSPAKRDLVDPEAMIDLSARTWRLLTSPPMSGDANMGLDEALLGRARRTGECVLRVYTWAGPTLSLGRNQLARGRIDAGRARRLGVDIVRRPTGGRALLHHREVTYSVTAPMARGESARRWYAAINSVLLDALSALGVGAEPAAVVGRPPAPGSASCFQRPEAGEIVVDGRKLVGSALLREDGALLQHGSILVDDDQELLVELLPPDEAGPAPAGTLRAVLGRVPAVVEVADALSHALLTSGVRDAIALDVDPALREGAKVAARRYASDEWTFRA